MDAGGFRMRVTNAGIVGNAFFNTGRSFDPSFEFPPHSGVEVLNYAALWVGAVDDRGRTRVSGGPLLEFRPTLDPDDVVRTLHRDAPGTAWLKDDDGDGRTDEEIFNDRDDDGDGLIDEDMGFTFERLMTAEYVDDRPEAVNFLYDTGESHVPLGLSVHQEVGAWSHAGFDGVAALRYTITHHGSGRLRDVYVGLLVDLDARLRDDRTGHFDDEIVEQSWSRTFNEGIGINIITIDGCIPGAPCDDPPPALPCFTTRSWTGPVIRDAHSNALPRITVVPLDHTVDPIARIGPIASHARAPATTSFRTSVFSARGVSGHGGVPRFDRDRYEALAGRLQTSAEDRDDHVVLLACGPFRTLDPGQSLTFEVALVAAESDDSLRVAVENLLYVHHGYWANLRPDYEGPDATEYDIGETGRNGHEVEIVSPASEPFRYDAHCTEKFPGVEITPSFPVLVTYEPGVPVWTDADCDECTGISGRETHVRWIDPGQVPPTPRTRLTGGDHVINVAWDNTAQALFDAGRYGTPESKFLGYRIYRVDDWRHRRGLLPPRGSWSMRAAFGPDSTDGASPLEEVTDETVAAEGVLFGETIYPPGRYVFRDTTALNGFDYVYVVTAAYEFRGAVPPRNGRRTILESPIVASFADRISPQAATRAARDAVWVVPNPFRGSAGWDRPATLGDPLPRHIDFMGLPPGRAVIKIWTVAGDLVARIDHDGASGDGQASWNLISRNGQDVESGIYLFTVESGLGTQRGKFVVIR